MGAKDTPIPRRLLIYKPSPRGEGGPLAVDEVQYLHLVYVHLEMPFFRFPVFIQIFHLSYIVSPARRTCGGQVAHKTT